MKIWLVLSFLLFGSAPGDETGDIAGDVTCPELQWPAFPAFKNNDVNTECWDEVQPSFRLYVAPGNGEMIQDTKTEGLAVIMD